MLAERIDVSRELLSRFEQGRSDLPPASKLAALREVGVSIDTRTREDRAAIVELPIPTIELASTRAPTLDPSICKELQAAFLDDVRPDSERVRDHWAVQAGLPSPEPFLLLAEHGRDAAGAIELVPAGSEAASPSLLPVSTRQQAIRALGDEDRSASTELLNRRIRIRATQAARALCR